MKLSIHLVAWNGAKYIPYLFESLRNQTFKDWFLLVWDNHSADKTVELIKKEMNNLGVQSKLMESRENLGFAGGHNKLISNFEFRISNFDYILLLNQDIYLLPDCLEKLVKFMDEHPEAAAITPRLMQWDFNKLHVTGYMLQDSFTDQIDSLGLRVFRNRRVVDWMAGQEIPNSRFQIPDSSLEVFGVSGALPLYRAKAIAEIGLFDEDFFSYKEDVDLAFRLRSVGWQAYCLLEAVAYHDRSAAGPKDDSCRAVIANRQKKSAIANYYSYRNHILTLLKNEDAGVFSRDWLFICWYELQKFVYLLFFEPKTLFRAWIDILRLWSKMMRKRKEIKEKRRIKAGELRKWFYV